MQSVLAFGGQAETYLRQYFQTCLDTWSIDRAVMDASDCYARGKLSDDDLAATFHIAAERRAAIAADIKKPQRPVPARWGTRVPVETLESLAQRREHAAIRFHLNNRFSKHLPDDVVALLPKQSAYRAILYAITMLAARDKGVCSASIALIAQMASCSRSSVNQGLAQLSEARWINVRSGAASATVSQITISPLLEPARRVFRGILGLIKARRAQKQGAKQTLSEGSVHKIEQKTESLFLNKNGGGVFAGKSGAKEDRQASFPKLGTIYHSRWHDLIREHAQGTVPDCDLVAKAFREFAQKHAISLALPHIEKVFISFVAKYRC